MIVKLHMVKKLMRMRRVLAEKCKYQEAYRDSAHYALLMHFDHGAFGQYDRVFNNFVAHTLAHEETVGLLKEHIATALEELAAFDRRRWGHGEYRYCRCSGRISWRLPRKRQYQ